MSWKEHLREKLLSQTQNATFLKGKGKLSVSIFFRTKGDWKPVFEWNHKEMMIPASLTKIFTALVALDTFPEKEPFKTELYMKRPLRRIHKGSLYLKGGGDPSFVSESMWNLVNNFVRQGVKEIHGDIVVDDSRFDRKYFDKTRKPTRTHDPYDAPVGAMSFNWNSLNLYIQSGKVNEKAKVFVDPQNSYVLINNKVKTVSKTNKKVKVVRRVPIKNGRKNKITLKGEVSSSEKEKILYVSISDPAYWSGENLKNFLKQRGIKVTGKVRKGRVPKGAIKVAEEKSKNLSLIVNDMMKYSNNYVAEMLVKNIAYEVGKKKGSIAGGVEAVEEKLSQIIPRDSFQVFNPSGFSNKNKVRVSALQDLSLYYYDEFPRFAEYLASLPVSGRDGTLKSRLNSVEGFVRAKTGLLNGVTGLAGFAQNKNKKNIFSFVMIYNGPRENTYEAKKLIDQMIKTLVNFKAK